MDAAKTFAVRTHAKQLADIFINRETLEDDHHAVRSDVQLEDVEPEVDGRAHEDDDNENEDESTDDPVSRLHGDGLVGGVAVVEIAAEIDVKRLGHVVEKVLEADEDILVSTGAGHTVTQLGCTQHG
jgi:hypothetical protein